MSLDRKKMLDMYYYLRLTRALEDRVRILYRQGKLPGGAYLSTGQEAISVGMAHALEPEDVIAISYRDLGAILVRGMEPAAIFAQYLGKTSSPTRGKDGSMHIGDLKLGIICPVSILADNIPVAAGIALAMKLMNKKNIAVAVFGEGASNRGDFHEGLNLASVKKLPVVYICTNNQFAYSTPLPATMAIKDVVTRAPGYGIPGQVVDGNDLVAVHSAVAQAAKRARQGEGPTLLECKTMRMTGHSEHDDAKYVPKKLLEEWKKRDPILVMERYLTQAKVLTKRLKEKIISRIAKEIEEGIKAAQEAPLPKGEEAGNDIYAPSS
ncbi:MAG: thiamine pyrophosphate-dependent dehydrogenase E1 component subunit alpha [Dehalococcoidia bacterium]